MGVTTKIQLSREESDLVNNTKWILSKHVITKKVYDMLGVLILTLKNETQSYYYLFPENVQYQSGKISKGENYMLLPYVILDYPAFFWKERIFAIRTMFWWGNFFSVSLHLSGKFKEQFTSDIPEVFLFLQKHNFFICINEDEWQHHFKEDNYRPAAAYTLDIFEGIKTKKFFKISKKISLSQWGYADEFIINTFKEIIQFLQISYQGDKKDPSPVFPKAGSGL